LIRENTAAIRKIKDLCSLKDELKDDEICVVLRANERNLGSGEVSIRADMPRSLYYQTISRETGLNIENDADLIEILSEMAASRRECEQISRALAEVREKGYGVVLPDPDQMRLEEPQIVRQNGKYSVRLRAGAPAIHLLMTDVETEVSPAIGGESASEDIISFLLQGFDGDVNRIWQSNIFGRSLNELAEEGLRSKLENLPDAAREKLRLTLERIINEGCAGLICLLL
jgi:stage IV sporulation protein A